MPYPSLVWTVFVIGGGFLLLNEAKLTTKNWIGVFSIFAGFVFQVFWEITHPWTDYSLASVIFVAVWLLITIPLLVWPGWLLKKKSSKG